MSPQTKNRAFEGSITKSDKEPYENCSALITTSRFARKMAALKGYCVTPHPFYRFAASPIY